MFNDKYGLTRAVLEGRKTQTRRFVTPSILQKAEQYQVDYFNDTLDALSKEEAIEEFSPYKVGEVVAIAQNYYTIFNDEPTVTKEAKEYAYRMGFRPEPSWGNKMFVRAKDMPHSIKITNIRVERLQDISDDDCEKEGVRRICHVSLNLDTYSVEDGGIEHLTPQEAYADLIDKISGKGTWKSNPWVFVYDFEF